MELLKVALNTITLPLLKLVWEIYSENVIIKIA
jgi:hypothetical protein